MDWEDGERSSFEDSDRFEEDSLCSWMSTESVCNNWRGWKRNSGGPGASGGSSALGPMAPLPPALLPSAGSRAINASAATSREGNNIWSLVELAAREVACHIPFEVVESVFPPVPEQLQLRIAYWSFPENEEDIRLYSCLANGNAEEFQRGENLIRSKSVKDMLQIGFHLSATVAPPQSIGVSTTAGNNNTTNNANNQASNTNATTGGSTKGIFNVAVTFDRRRITSCNCTCHSAASWCSHVVSVCLARIHAPASVTLRAPVSESLSRLARDQLQKFAQYLISELPQQILPTAQRLLDELLSSQQTAINTLCGAPDPTAGASISEQTTWCLDETQLHENIHKILIKLCVPSPIVFSDVNYLSSTAPPAAAEWQSLLRPLRGREPEGMWNLLAIVREMYRRSDRNAIPLLEILTTEVLACEQIVLWWFATKVSFHSGVVHGSKGNMHSNTHASQHACSSLCDEIVYLWRLGALNPGLSPEDRRHFTRQLCDWHVKTLQLVYKSRQASGNGQNGTQNQYGLHNLVMGHAGGSNGTHHAKKSDFDIFPGFKPALEVCLLDWSDYPIAGVTFDITIASRRWYAPTAHAAGSSSASGGASLITSTGYNDNSSAHFHHIPLPKIAATHKPSSHAQVESLGLSKLLETKREIRRTTSDIESTRRDTEKRVDEKSDVLPDLDMFAAGPSSRFVSSAEKKTQKTLSVIGTSTQPITSVGSVNSVSHSTHLLTTSTTTISKIDSSISNSKSTHSSQESIQLPANDGIEPVEQDRKKSSARSSLSSEGFCETTGDELAAIAASSSGLNQGSASDSKSDENMKQMPKPLPADSKDETTAKKDDDMAYYFFDAKLAAAAAAAAASHAASLLSGPTQAALEELFTPKVRRSDDEHEILFLRAEALHAHGHSSEACRLAVRLAASLLSSPPQLTTETQNASQSQNQALAQNVGGRTGKRARRFNPISHQISLLASTTLSKTAFLCTVLQESSLHHALAFRVGLFGLEMNRPPASTKALEVKLVNQEQELVALMKRIPLTEVMLDVIRAKARALGDRTLRPRGDALLPLMLASYIFDALIISAPQPNPGLSRNSIQVVSGRREGDEELGFNAAVEALGLKANVSEADHPLLCEGTRRQRGDLALTLLFHYKDDQMRLNKIMERLLDKSVHQMYRNPLFPGPTATSPKGSETDNLVATADASKNSHSSNSQSNASQSAAGTMMREEDEFPPANATLAGPIGVGGDSFRQPQRRSGANASNGGERDLSPNWDVNYKEWEARFRCTNLKTAKKHSVGMASIDSSAPETTSSDNSPTIVRRSLFGGRGAGNAGGPGSDSGSSGESSDSFASSSSGPLAPGRVKNGTVANVSAARDSSPPLTVVTGTSSAIASATTGALASRMSTMSIAVDQSSVSNSRDPTMEPSTSGTSSNVPVCTNQSAAQQGQTSQPVPSQQQPIQQPLLGPGGTVKNQGGNNRFGNNNLGGVKGKSRPYPSVPNQASEASAHFMFELAKTVLTKAGGNSSTAVLFTAAQAQVGGAGAAGAAGPNGAVGGAAAGGPRGPHRALHMCAFQIGVYALGLHNAVSSNWLSRTYSSHVSWISGQAVEIGSPAIHFLIETWEGHLTPPEVASLADRASRNRDPAMVRAAAELSLSCLPHAHALNPNEIQRALIQCREQSNEMLERACLAVESAAGGGGVYPEILFEVAHKWYGLFEEESELGSGRDGPGGAGRRGHNGGRNAGGSSRGSPARGDVDNSLPPSHHQIGEFGISNASVNNQMQNQAFLGGGSPAVGDLGIYGQSHSQVAHYPHHVNSSVAHLQNPMSQNVAAAAAYAMTMSAAGYPYTAGFFGFSPSQSSQAALQASYTSPSHPSISYHIPSSSAVGYPFGFGYPPHPQNAHMMAPVTSANGQLINMATAMGAASIRPHHLNTIAGPPPPLGPPPHSMQQALALLPVPAAAAAAALSNAMPMPSVHNMMAAAAARSVYTLSPASVAATTMAAVASMSHAAAVANGQQHNMHAASAHVGHHHVGGSHHHSPAQSPHGGHHHHAAAAAVQIPQYTDRQLHLLLSAYRVGMLAMETLARRVHDDRPQAKYARNPSYGEDVKWLLTIAKKLGTQALQDFCLCTVNSVFSPFILYEIIAETALFLSPQPNIAHSVRNHLLNPLVQKCQQMFIACAHFRMYHITPSDYDEFVQTILTAQKAFNLTTGGMVQFQELLQSLRRSKSCKKELWQLIQSALQSPGSMRQ